MLFVAASVLLRKEIFQEFSLNLTGAVTEDLLRAMVEEGDPLIFINRDDGVGCDFDDAGKQRLLSA